MVKNTKIILSSQAGSNTFKEKLSQATANLAPTLSEALCSVTDSGKGMVRALLRGGYVRPAPDDG